MTSTLLTAEGLPGINGTGKIWTGRIMTAVPALFLAMDASMKLLQVQAAVDGTVELGYPPSVLFPLGIVQALALILYLAPPTAVLGAIVWTAYLGGAVATHVRIGNPLFTHVLSPVYVAALLWGALWVRDERVRGVLPLSARTPRRS